MEEKQNIQQLALQLRGFAVFRALLQDEVLHGLLACADAEKNENLSRQVECYAEFVSCLYRAGGNLGNHLLRLILESENQIVLCKAKGQPILPAMWQCMQAELHLCTALSALFPADVMPADAGVELPLWESTRHDFYDVYNARLGNIATKGYGVFASYHVFTLGQGTRLHPVKNPDSQRLSRLTGYQRERGQILVNTQALLNGLPANNILLYGDAGTGKSSTVKALANEYHTQGLRLVEIRKDQLYQIPDLMDILAENPLTFILFIDDLSFPTDDKDFTALKAILEGNVAARPRNIVVYATSNRRHLVKENFASRQMDIHEGDTREEEASLAARFGLTITFIKPDKELYGDIVKNLAAEYEVHTPFEQLFKAAEAHALRYGGRSPRVARQFVEYWKAVEAGQ
ncbi:MAG: ATP-binding protein [Oscillospiraceae bacterium]